MHTGNGRVIEVILEDGYRYARISCAENLIPDAGQYLLAGDGRDSLLPAPIFYTDSAPQGFISTAPDWWNPGEMLFLRGPLGRAFSLPVSARKIALIAFDESPARLRALIQPALRQQASVVLACDWDVISLPDEVEVQPLSSLQDILTWADYLALDVSRENLSALKEQLGRGNHGMVVRDAQVLIRTSMPCGGSADCGVCAVITKSGWTMACKDGPVFDFREI
jgi:hypothetical protein